VILRTDGGETADIKMAEEGRVHGRTAGVTDDSTGVRVGFSYRRTTRRPTEFELTR